MNDETVICARCKSQTNALAIFPGGICLACYEKAYDATPEQERETIIAVFGNGSEARIYRGRRYCRACDRDRRREERANG